MICWRWLEMFGIVKRIFGKNASGSTAPAKSVPLPAPARGVTPAQSKANSSPAAAPIAASGRPPVTPRTPTPTSAPVGSGEAIKLSLSSVVRFLPEELKVKVNLAAAEGVLISLPAEQVVEQLSHGSVKLSFGQLRLLAPAGVFQGSSSHDENLVDLPLGEILGQIKAQSLPKRTNQKKRVQVPEDITGPFGSTGGPNSGAAGKPASNPAGQPAPVVPQPAASLPTPASAPVNRAAAVHKPTGISPPVAPAAKAASAPAPATPIPVSAALREQALAAMQAVSGRVAGANKPVPSAVDPVAAPKPAPLAAALKSAPPIASEVFSVPLAQISSGWPEAVRQEIEQLNLAPAVVELPADQIASGLKTGRVAYKWNELLAALKPDPGPTSAMNGESVLELPLQILAPIFLAHRRPAAAQKLTAVAENIPDLFSGNKPAPAVVPTPAAPPPSAPAPAPATAVSTSNTDLVRRANTGSVGQTEFLRRANTVVHGNVECLMVPLGIVNDTWLEPLRLQIANCNMPDLRVELPVDEVAHALKCGKVEYTWRQLRAKIRPELPENLGAEYADTLLTLPLNIVAPLFLSQHRPKGTPKKLAAGESIPDLFSAAAAAGETPAPSASASAAAPPTAPSAPVAPAAPAPAPKSFPTSTLKKPSADLGELFGQPGKRNWTPNEIVQKASRFDGVAGAIIAMQDGLLVASQMPLAWKSELTAAFLPQIFGRVRQCTQELKVGALDCVSVNLDSGTLVIFNAGIIYFAALSKPGEALPLAHLTLIVNELGRHTK